MSYFAYRSNLFHSIFVISPSLNQNFSQLLKVAELWCLEEKQELEKHNSCHTKART